MRAAIITVVANVVLTIAFTTPLLLNKMEGAHVGIALATALAGIVNAALLWRYLRRAGVYAPQPGWRGFSMRLLLACVVMTAVVLALRFWVGQWTAIDGWENRALWLLLVIAAGAAAYGLTLLATGLRARDLRGR